ncbi:GntR family transcriptional regulator [Jeotgalibacillus soli]|uniref:GntR family transcriptional regulator n=1 Tax=Jeotgalibacillus soli TaxID=889306 RepID=A0A0C2VJ62_9BACL|nr:GntR family transcriptional regulator [Jeotgalibacillus soli]KIL44511.1 GntR family transcriptional regulator [Jeotgalibacillus soli]
MTNEFHASTPIYLQIAIRVQQQIAKHEWKPGDQLPSVREMAIQSSENPNAIQRSYQELERMGVVETRRGQGTFIVQDFLLPSKMKEELQKEIIDQFINQMKAIDSSDEEILA